MTRRSSRLCLFTTAWITLTAGAQAATLAQWQERATGFVARYEGSAFDAVTLDMDCQGLSLGKEQYALAVNSTAELFAEIDRLAKEEDADMGLAAIVDETAGDKAAELKALIAESFAGDANRVVRARSWQQIKVGGAWVDLDEGECKTNKKRTVTTKNLRLKDGYLAALEALLAHPASVAAQGNLLARRGRLALERATCWARAARKSQTPNFQEYLFFFDYLIQNGDKFTTDGTLQLAALKIGFDDAVPEAAKDGAVRAKMLQMRDWLAADFPHMRNTARTIDHSDYAKTNAVDWFKRFEAGGIDKNQVRLAYIGLLRAMLGNNQWAYNAMNRRGTILFAGGTANGVPYSADTMRELLTGAGALDADVVAGITCR